MVCLPRKADSILLNGLMDSCEEIITIKDLNYKYLTCNNAFLKHFNLTSQAQIIGKTVFEMLQADNADCIKKNIDEAIKSKKPQSYIFKVLMVEGSKIVHQTSTPLIKDGKVQYILSISRDITKDELMKEELIRKNVQINTMLEYMPVLLYMKDKNKQYLIGSKYAKDFVFYGIDNYADGLQIDLSLAQGNINAEDNYVLNNKSSLVIEKSAKDKNGEMHWYNVLKAPILREDNSIDGLVTIARNIDKQKLQESQKDLFIATLVHDLKNPLLAQISCIDQCCNGLFGELNDTQKEILSITLESANYMKDMLYTLINTYKYDNGNIKLNIKETNIAELIKTCIREIKSLAKERNLNLIFTSNINDKDATADVDLKQIRRVISNLLNNGVNYAYENTDFNISLETDGKFLKIAMENIGPPINEETQEHLFEKYISKANRFQKVGFGLGMYLSKQIMEAHGGSISYQGNGDFSKFILEIKRENTNAPQKINW